MEEDEPTQQATQVVIDPRRLGQANSGLNDEDIADIFCILHPASIPAHRAAALIRELTPNHTISTRSTVKVRERILDSTAGAETFDLATQAVTSCDIVLRLSAKLKDPAGGFRFGRNSARCDFILGRDDEVKRISNTHFRIYINEYGTIMLEDQSTNGTAVEGIMLRAKDKENGREYRHTIEQGNTIVLTMTPPEEDFRFIVRIPQRDEIAELAYRQNLTNYFHQINNANLAKQRQTRNVAASPGRHEPPNIFAIPDAEDPTMSNVGRYVREWRGGAKYNKIGTIGKGAFATVYKVTAKFDGVPFAAKELEKRRFMKNGILDQKVDNEMNIMKRIKHPNVVRYIEHVDWEEYLYIIMEYVPNGDLGSLIHRSGQLPESDVKTMASQLLSALKYLHEMQVTHRDVKPDNILIHSFNPLHVKLTDFGLSKMVDSEETFLRTFCGTLLYCAPEVYSEYREYDLAGRRNPRGIPKRALPPQRYDDAVDIWSLAGVLFYALCGSPPYPVKNGTTYQELLNHIMTQPLDIRPLQMADVSDSGIRFVRSMLHTRPEHRATITELETASWFRGDQSLEISIEEDDVVDMIDDGFIDPHLEDDNSQLSIHDGDRHQINDSQEDPQLQSVSDLTEIQQREIPSSFNSDDHSNGSYGFAPALAANGGRLFGEVNIAALGSSGAIALDHLPVPIVDHRGTFGPPDFSQESDVSHIDHSNDLTTKSGTQHPTDTQNAYPITMAMPPPPARTSEPITPTLHEAEERATRSSSLMGAESLVGHLNMHSPASVASPTASPTTDFDVPLAANVQDVTISLRRPRQEYEDDSENQSWRPSDLPPNKRHRSQREIIMPVHPSVFWDPKDRSTHHNNYPAMSNTDLTDMTQYAEEKGEAFRHGQKTFDVTMESFRSSRSPSMEPEAIRARSEPIREDDRRVTMRRDERKLSEGVTKILTAVEPRALDRDASLPVTQHGSDQPPTTTTNSETVSSAGTPDPVQQTLDVDDFQPPKRILAKLIATSDSCLPTIVLNVTERFTSWGRGFNNTVRYPNGNETRIPKNAFKLVLYSIEKWSTGDEHMSFFVSSKASMGIKVNDVILRSHDKEPNTPSRYWAELRHGDLLTLWWHNNTNPEKEFTRFRFECYRGKSKELRTADQPFQCLPDGEVLNEIEAACAVEENNAIAETTKREQEERKMREQEKQARKVHIHHSFVGRSASAH